MLILEAGVTPADAGNIIADLKDGKDVDVCQVGWNMRFGTMAPGRERGPNNLVSAAVRAPAPAWTPPLSEDDRDTLELIDSGR